MDEIEISGIDELRQRYLDDIIVELRPLLRDGKPAAFKCRQLRPLAYMAMGKGIPIPQAKTNGDGGQEADEVERERYEYMKKVVSRSIVAIREAWRDSTHHDWQERWTPVEVVYDDPAPINGLQRHIDDLDFSDNVVRCFNAIFANIMEGGRLEGTGAARFRSAGHGDGLPVGQALGQVAARDRAGKKRRAGVGH